MQDLSLQLFGKSIYQLCDDDLHSFFSTEQEETALLEFKSGEVSLEKIYKEVAAFANTEGGVIVIGSPVEKVVQRLSQPIKVCQGALTSSQFKNRDWLLQKIASQVVPLPPGIRIQEMQQPDSRRFVIEVPQSLTPPHQVIEDGVYYIRLDRHARPAPHSFVQALFNKRRAPILEAILNIYEREPGKSSIEAVVHNRAHIPADRVSMLVEVHNVTDIESTVRFDRDEAAGIKRWYGSVESDKVLVNPLGMTFKMEATHTHRPFFVSIGFWSIDCDYAQNWWIYDPMQKAILTEGTMDNKKESLSQFRIKLT